MKKIAFVYKSFLITNKTYFLNLLIYNNIILYEYNTQPVMMSYTEYIIFFYSDIYLHIKLAKLYLMLDNIEINFKVSQLNVCEV